LLNILQSFGQEGSFMSHAIELPTFHRAIRGRRSISLIVQYFILYTESQKRVPP